MEKPFDEPHLGIRSQVLGTPETIPDSPQVLSARQAGDFEALGQALSRQLRYREAIEAYSRGLVSDPENLRLLRLRAGRYLTTLQPERALADFERCLSLGADRLDCGYRIGLALFYLGRYSAAAGAFRDCIPLCDEEMGIAVIYWHTLSACRGGAAPALLGEYHSSMAVGHHTAYEKAVAVWAGARAYSQAEAASEQEPEDLEYGIAQYGLAYHPDCPDRQALLEKICARDGFWPCFSYLAAWKDLHEELFKT